MKAVQDDSLGLMRVLGQRLDCIFHEPVYLSRMLSLKESEFPRLRQGIPHSRPLVHIMGLWPLGTRASCLKKSDGRFSHILEI